MFSRGSEPTGDGMSSVAKAKPFDIPKREVWLAFKKVKANQGAAGVDGQTVAGFEADLYPVQVRTRKSLGEMMRKLSVTASQ